MTLTHRHACTRTHTHTQLIRKHAFRSPEVELFPLAIRSTACPPPYSPEPRWLWVTARCHKCLPDFLTSGIDLISPPPKPLRARNPLLPFGTETMVQGFLTAAYNCDAITSQCSSAGVGSASPSHTSFLSFSPSLSEMHRLPLLLADSQSFPENTDCSHSLLKLPRHVNSWG